MVASQSSESKVGRGQFGRINVAEHDGVPTGDEFQRGLLSLSRPIAPFEFDLHFRGWIHFAQTKMDIRAATAGVTAAAIDLPDELAAIWQHDAGLGTDRGAAVQIDSRMSGALAQRSVGVV